MLFRMFNILWISELHLQILNDRLIDKDARRQVDNNVFHIL